MAVRGALSFVRSCRLRRLSNFTPSRFQDLKMGKKKEKRTFVKFDPDKFESKPSQRDSNQFSDDTRSKGGFHGGRGESSRTNKPKSRSEAFPPVSDKKNVEEAVFSEPIKSTEVDNSIERSNDGNEAETKPHFAPENCWTSGKLNNKVHYRGNASESNRRESEEFPGLGRPAESSVPVVNKPEVPPMISVKVDSDTNERRVWNNKQNEPEEPKQSENNWFEQPNNSEIAQQPPQEPKYDRQRPDKSNNRQNRQEKHERGRYVPPHEKSREQGRHEPSQGRRDTNKNSYKSSKQSGPLERPKDWKLNIEEVKGDLFEAPDDYSLAHCVAEDLSMNAGIAIEFRKKFKGTGELFDQAKKTGEVAILKDKNRFIYYLITKRLSRGKPTLESLTASLRSMREHVVENDVKKIAMPMIGSGLDLLDWDSVKNRIEHVFGDLDIEIRIYVFEKTDDSKTIYPVRSAKLIRNSYSIIDLDPRDAVMVYLVSENLNVTEEMKLLDSKHRFLSNLSSGQSAKLGDIIPIRNTCGLICRDRDNKLSFDYLEKCLKQLIKHCSSQKAFYVGIEVDGDILQDEMFLTKYSIALRFGVHKDMEVHLCSVNLQPERSY